MLKSCKEHLNTSFQINYHSKLTWEDYIGAFLFYKAPEWNLSIVFTQSGNAYFKASETKVQSVCVRVL